MSSWSRAVSSRSGSFRWIRIRPRGVRRLHRPDDGAGEEALGHAGQGLQGLEGQSGVGEHRPGQGLQQVQGRGTGRLPAIRVEARGSGSWPARNFSTIGCTATLPRCHSARRRADWDRSPARWAGSGAVPPPAPGILRPGRTGPARVRPRVRPGRMRWPATSSATTPALSRVIEKGPFMRSRQGSETLRGVPLGGGGGGHEVAAQALHHRLAGVHGAQGDQHALLVDRNLRQHLADHRVTARPGPWAPTGRGRPPPGRPRPGGRA